jgi:hypothetical protein
MRHWNATAHTEENSHRHETIETPQLILRCSLDGVKWCTNARTASFEKPKERIVRIVAAYSLYVIVNATRLDGFGAIILYLEAQGDMGVAQSPHWFPESILSLHCHRN